MIDSLDGIKRELSSTLENNSLFMLINTRLILRTGVDLGSIRPAENRDSTAVAKVLSALSAMGYPLNATTGKPRS